MGKIYKLYHGTIADFSNVDLTKSLDKKDFGRGFYTTRDVNIAKDWAIRHMHQYGSKVGYIYCIAIDIQELRKIFNVHEFKLSKEWIDYLADNRVYGRTASSYDLVIGPIADAAAQRELEIYTNSIRGISAIQREEMKEKLIRKLMQVDYGIQYCFKSQSIVEYINNRNNCKWTRKEIYR